MEKLIKRLGVLLLLTLCAIIVLVIPKQVQAPTSFEGNSLGYIEKRPFRLLLTRTPERVSLEKLGVSALTEKLQVDENGELSAPEDFSKVGYFDYYRNNLILVGHYDNIDGSPAIFYQLKNITDSDIIEMTANESSTKYKVVEKKEVLESDYNALKSIFKDHENDTLTLITCGGVWNPELHKYDKRIIVLAKRV
jgi:LPXTG-site transpeptidase (sortase) family protein